MSSGNVSRRTALKWGAAAGVTAPFLSSFLAGCSSSGSTNGKVEHVNLKGESLALTILGVAGWPPSQMSVDFGNKQFKSYAKSKLGYDVGFKSSDAPFGQLFQKAATSLATKSQEFNLIVSDSQWLGAFAQPKWIIPLNKVIDANKSLQLEWYSDVVTNGYMTYPEGTKQVYGLPQEGDTMVLYVRKDMLEDPKERAAFKAKYKKEMPKTFSDFEKMTWDDYAPVMEFFTRGDQGMYGISLQYSKEYDDFSCYYYPFVFSRGNEIWDSESKNVQGILNTDANAAALEEFVALKKYCPPGADQVGIPEMADLFTQGKVFSCIQWAAMGPAMIPDDLKGKVMVVPPPAFKEGRTYTLGGQPWVVNAFNDKNNMQGVIDFLKWWYLPDTQLAYAKAGGNPCDRATLESSGFDDLQPWFKAYKYMLQSGKTTDFWHDPNYAKMLSDQQEAFTAYSTGQVKDARQALDYVAYKQQQTLHEAGATKKAPTGTLPTLK
jgi:multiple sugar transport system substrate-binding protein